MPVINHNFVEGYDDLFFEFGEFAFDEVEPRLEDELLVVVRGEFAGEGGGVAVEVGEGEGDQ
jgi:hypothetical protein